MLTFGRYTLRWSVGIYVGIESPNNLQLWFYFTRVKSDNIKDSVPTPTTEYWQSKGIAFGDVFFLAPLTVESLCQIKYTAKCAFIKILNQPPGQIHAK